LIEIAFKEFASIDWNNSNITSDEQLEKLYSISEIFEERHMEKESLHFYKNIFAKDVNFKDVKQKIEELDNKLLMSKTIDESTGLSLEIRRRYADIEELGKGGMGIVYKARDKKLGRTVALKVMHGEFVNNKMAVSRFLKEAKAIATLNHPNIIGIFDVNSDKNVYIAMEYVEGKNLKQLLSSHKIVPLEKVIEITEKVCDALESAHKQGIIHRDIKPENVMIDKNGNVKLMDFGLAITNEESTNNEVLGTPFFMSPEQIRGDSVDKRTDVYALGVSLFQLVCGKLPFGDGDIKERHLTENPVSPSSINKLLPIEIDGIILKCLAKNPAHRYSSAFDLKNDILNIRKLIK
jgi:serine/threonine-protein kinase